MIQYITKLKVKPRKTILQSNISIKKRVIILTKNSKEADKHKLLIYQFYQPWRTFIDPLLMRLSHYIQDTIILCITPAPMITIFLGFNLLEIYQNKMGHIQLSAIHIDIEEPSQIF